MPQVANNPGPGGSLVNFSSLAVNIAFTFGGVYFWKQDDAHAFNLATGQKVEVLPAQQVSVIAVSWDVVPFTKADVGGGDAFYDPDGAKWINVEGGAIHVQSMTYADDGNVPPLRATSKLTTLNVDE